MDNTHQLSRYGDDDDAMMMYRCLVPRLADATVSRGHEELVYVLHVYGGDIIAMVTSCVID